MAFFKDNTLFLSSGRQIKLSSSKLSISPTLEIWQGWYTAVIGFNTESSQHEDVKKVSNPYNLSAEDVFEIADYNVNCWQALKEKIRLHGMEDEKIFVLPEKL